MYRKKLSLFCLWSVFVSCSAFAGKNLSEPIQLALNWKPEPQFGGFYAADSLRLFKNAKLDVNVIPGGSGTPTIQMLAAGKVEYAVVSADEIIIANDRGSKGLVAVFASYQTNPQGIMARSDRNYSGIKEIMSDPKATLLWQSGLPYALYLTQKYGKPKTKTAPYSGGISHFLQAKNINQQCFVTSEPLAAQKAKTAVSTFLIADEGYNPYTTVLVTTRKRLQAKPDEVKALVRALRAGWTAYLESPEKTNALMTKMNPAMDSETMAASAKAQQPLIETDWTRGTSLGQMQGGRWQTLIDQLESLKLIKSKPSAAELFENIQ